MNQAVAQGLAFGREIIFTFGPYAFVFTQDYHPATDTFMLFSCAYLAAIYLIYVISLMRLGHRRGLVAYCLFLTCMLYPRDALLFSVPFLLALSVYQTHLSKAPNLAPKKWEPLYIALLFSPLGLLPLVKGSLFILCTAVALLCSVFFVHKKQKLIAVICLLSPICSGIFFWLLIGQTLTDLPRYIVTMIPIISGYSEAMAWDGNSIEVIVFVLICCFMSGYIASRKNVSNHAKSFGFILNGLILFLSFKAGFIHHDIHALTAGNTIFIAALLWPVMFYDGSYIYVLLLSGIAFIGLTTNTIEFHGADLILQSRHTYVSAFCGLRDRIFRPNWLQQEFVDTLTKLKKTADFPPLQGTTDIYSYDQSYLIASQLRWSPRPILQSYSAYTPALASINRQHLIGDQAPQNIIFKLQTIDGQLPALMDGPSWPVLMKNYHSTHLQNGYLFLEKKAGINTEEDRLSVSTVTGHLGKPIALPDLQQPVFAQIEIKPSLLGRVASFLYKPSPLTISLKSYRGQISQYRFIAGMGRSTFLISPLIESTYEFALLTQNSPLLNVKRLKSITISATGSAAVFWDTDYTISLSKFSSEQPANEALLNIDQ